MKVMGTGSRSLVNATDRQATYDNLDAYICMLRDEHPDLTLISGMAEGWDEAIAKIGMRRNIPYDVYLPNAGYGKYYWSAAHSQLSRDRLAVFDNLVAHAANIIIVCNSLYVNGVHANFVRNQAMVDACDMALVYNAASSGTRDAVARLKMAHKPYRISPFDLQMALPILNPVTPTH